MRYKGIKGKFWQTFSEFIRKRDFKRWGKCVACGRRVSNWKDFNAGHFAPASNCGFLLLFSEKNVHGECPGCNAFDPGHLIPFRSNLVQRYGETYVVEVENTYNNSRYKGRTTKEWPKKVYEEKIAEYKIKLESLR